MGLAKQALVYTLIVHVIVLGAMLVWPVSKRNPQVRCLPRWTWWTRCLKSLRNPTKMP